MGTKTFFQTKRCVLCTLGTSLLTTALVLTGCTSQKTPIEEIKPPPPITGRYLNQKSMPGLINGLLNIDPNTDLPFPDDPAIQETQQFIQMNPLKHTVVARISSFTTIAPSLLSDANSVVHVH